MQIVKKTHPEAPEILHARVSDLAPIIVRWMEKHPGVQITQLLRRALKKELQPYAGKRYAHLLES